MPPSGRKFNYWLPITDMPNPPRRTATRSTATTSQAHRGRRSPGLAMRKTGVLHPIYGEELAALDRSIEYFIKLRRKTREGKSNVTTSEQISKILARLRRERDDILDAIEQSSGRKRQPSRPTRRKKRI